MPRLTALLLAVTLASSILLVALSAPAANAYSHSWQCQSAAYKQCYDYSGQQYNPWVYVYASMYATSDVICAKAITAAGNVRTPQACAYSSTVVAGCIDPYPESQAYVYWGGAGTIRTINGYARTLSC